MAVSIRWTRSRISRLVARPTTRLTKLRLINVSAAVLSWPLFSKAWDVHVNMSNAPSWLTRGSQAQAVLRSWAAVRPCCQAAAACSLSMAARSPKVR